MKGTAKISTTILVLVGRGISSFIKSMSILGSSYLVVISMSSFTNQQTIFNVPMSAFLQAFYCALNQGNFKTCILKIKAEEVIKQGTVYREKTTGIVAQCNPCGGTCHGTVVWITELLSSHKSPLTMPTGAVFP